MSKPAEVWYACGCKASSGAPKVCPEHCCSVCGRQTIEYVQGVRHTNGSPLCNPTPPPKKAGAAKEKNELVNHADILVGSVPVSSPADSGSSGGGSVDSCVKTDGLKPTPAPQGPGRETSSCIFCGREWQLWNGTTPQIPCQSPKNINEPDAIGRKFCTYQFRTTTASHPVDLPGGEREGGRKYLLTLVPISLSDACEFVRQIHRHHASLREVSLLSPWPMAIRMPTGFMHRSMIG